MHSTKLGKPFKRLAPLSSQNDPSKLPGKYWQKASSKTPHGKRDQHELSQSALLKLAQSNLKVRPLPFQNS